MTLKDKLHKHRHALKTTAVVAGGIAAAATVTVLGAKLADRTLMLNAAMDVIKDQGGNATELISDKIANRIAKTLVN